MESDFDRAVEDVCLSRQEGLISVGESDMMFDLLIAGKSLTEAWDTVHAR